MDLPQELITKLKQLAKKKVRCDDEEFCAMDWFGGNFDDAYSGGLDDGQVILAQEILDAIGEKY